MSKCKYCLCIMCSRIACPRGRWKCWNGHCNSGTVYECCFFTRRKVTKTYRIKSISPSISVQHLRQLRDSINTILGEYPEPEEQPDTRTLHEKLYAEDQRHRAELQRIVREAQDRTK